jgi:hypothetical protein
MLVYRIIQNQRYAKLLKSGETCGKSDIAVAGYFRNANRAALT